jgi:hypothetical protein
MGRKHPELTPFPHQSPKASTAVALDKAWVASFNGAIGVHDFQGRTIGKESDIPFAGKTNGLASPSPPNEDVWIADGSKNQLLLSRAVGCRTDASCRSLGSRHLSGRPRRRGRGRIGESDPPIHKSFIVLVLVVVVVLVVPVAKTIVDEHDYVWGVDVIGQDNAGSPGSGGASPYPTLHGLTGVMRGSGNPWVGDGMGGTTIGLNSGSLGGSGFGVTTGTGTSKPGFLADAGLVFSTGGS